MAQGKVKACRFPHNPEEFWGPKARARTKAPAGTAVDASASSSAGAVAGERDEHVVSEPCGILEESGVEVTAERESEEPAAKLPRNS